MKEFSAWLGGASALVEKIFFRDSALPESSGSLLLRWPTWPRPIGSGFPVWNKGLCHWGGSLAMNAGRFGTKITEESAKMVLLLLAKVTIMVV